MNDWIEWNGESGKPEGLDGEDWVEVMFSDGDTAESIAQNFGWTWRVGGTGGDIVKYRKKDKPNFNRREEHDPVEHPKHYQLLPGVEVYDVRHAILDKLEDVPPSQVDDWSRSWEYITRMWQKNGLEDAKKARWYLDKLIGKMEE